MSSPSPIDEKRQVRLMAVLFLLFMAVLALIPAVKSVAGCEWSALIDLHRDQAFVHALLEGHYGRDPVYLGAYLWYPPLIIWLESALVWITGLPVQTAITQLGPYVNLLSVICFFAMAWYFLGPARAALTTAIFLFFTIGQEPAHAAASYSARLIPVAFSQAFFYLELILIDKAFRHTGWKWTLAAGIGAGITFLGHPAPALLAVGMIVIFTAIQLLRLYRRGEQAAMRQRLIAGVVAGVAFLIVTLPITWYIVGHHGMHTLNRTGFLFSYYALSLHEAATFLHYNVSLFNLLGILGLWMLWRRPGRTAVPHRVRGILLLWVGLSVLLFLYSYLVDFVDTHMGIHLPGTVPTFHYFFYMKGAMGLMAGIAIWQLFAWAWVRIDKRIPREALADRARPVLVLLSLTALACTLIYPSYATRRDLWVGRNRDIAFAMNQQGIQVAEQIRTLVSWDDVVLCDQSSSYFPMLSTGRHVVATVSTFGNPYVGQHEREQDNEQLLLAMENEQPGTADLLAKYGVTHLLVRRDDLARLPLARQWFPRDVFHNDGYVLLGR